MSTTTQALPFTDGLDVYESRLADAREKGLRVDIEAEVQRWRGVGECAHADRIDSGGRNIADAIQRHIP